MRPGLPLPLATASIYLLQTFTVGLQDGLCPLDSFLGFILRRGCYLYLHCRALPPAESTMYPYGNGFTGF